MRFLIEIFMLVAISCNFGQNYYTGKWLAALGIALLFLWHKVSIRFGAIAATTLIYFLIHSFWLLLVPPASYVSLTNENLAIIKYLTADSSLRLLVILLPFLLYDGKYWICGELLACFFVIMSLGQIFWEAFFRGCAGENTCGGALANPSINAGMMVCCLPFIFQNFMAPQKWIITALVGFGCVLGKSNIGLGMLGLFMLTQVPKKYWLALPPLFLAGGYFIGPKFLSSGDRFMMWRFFMEKWFMGRHNLLFGTGLGSFGLLAGDLQTMFNMNPGWPFRWMHNDWLQEIFETGIVGGALMVATYCTALRGLIKNRLFHHAKSFAFFGVYMGCNFPLHIGLTSAFGAWLACLGFSKLNFTNDNGLSTQELPWSGT